MPEPDTFDLDAAFRALEQNVADISSPRGAGVVVAVATARRRRRTTAGVFVAAAALAVGGVVVGHGLGGADRLVEPSDQVPSIAPLDDAVLTAATAGWTPAWTAGTRQARQQLALTFGGYCMNGEFGARGGSAGAVPFGNAHDDLAVEIYGTYPRAASGYRDLAKLYEKTGHCPRATLISSFSYPSGAQSRTYRVAPGPNDSAPEYLWIVGNGRGIGKLKVLGQSKTLPETDDRPVADALLADLLEREAADPNLNPQDGPGRIDPTETLGQVWAEYLEPAVTGWDTSWDPSLRDGGPPLAQPPCTSSFLGDTGPSETVNVGTDGHEWVQWYDSEDEATSALDRIQQDLQSCATPYTFHTVNLPDGRPVLVGVGPQVFWTTRVASHVLTVSLPPGSTPPPDDVSVQVGTVLEHVLEQPATTTMSPDKHTTVAPWMQKEIDAAPTFGP